MSPPGLGNKRKRRFGIAGEISGLDPFGPGLDTGELGDRGWTLGLIDKFLGDEDRRDPVNHWANFSGKKVYLVARVEAAESNREFEAEFCRSAKRRKLTEEFTSEVLSRIRQLQSKMEP